MAHKIVTSATPDYLPGVKALYNSYLEHSQEGFEFWVMAYGNDNFVKALVDEGMNVINSPVVDAKRLPLSRRFNTPNLAMYSRLLVPHIFTDDYSIFIDADAIILKDLTPLLTGFDQPCAGTKSWSHVTKEIIPTKLNFFGMMASFIIFNRKQYIEGKILDRCIDSMESITEFPSVVQGVLQSVIKDNWHELPLHIQAHGGREESIQWLLDDKPYILHFAGTNPWCEFPPGVQELPHKTTMRALWRSYT